MNFFIDTEFIDDGKTLELISIGIVCEDGRYYYAESSEYDESKASDWVKDNVISKLKGTPKPLKQIRHELIRFIDKCRGYKSPHFWCYFGAWDWLLFCRTISRTGQLMDLPAEYPHLFFELVQLANENGCPHLIPMMKASNKNAHNSLDDARWTMEVYNAIIRFDELNKRKIKPV